MLFQLALLAVSGRLFIQRTTVELKLAGIALKQPKVLKKHHKFRQRDQVRNSD